MLIEEVNTITKIIAYRRGMPANPKEMLRKKC